MKTNIVRYIDGDDFVTVCRGFMNLNPDAQKAYLEIEMSAEKQGFIMENLGSTGIAETQYLEEQKEVVYKTIITSQKEFLNEFKKPEEERDIYAIAEYVKQAITPLESVYSYSERLLTKFWNLFSNCVSRETQKQLNKIEDITLKNNLLLNILKEKYL